jgi:hypothetical protein
MPESWINVEFDSRIVPGGASNRVQMFPNESS